MRIDYESGFDTKTIETLHSYGHSVNQLPFEYGFSAVTAISRRGGAISATYDPRRQGNIELH